MAKRRSHALALPAVALFLGATGCGRGCTCISGEKSYEHLDGTVKVELVRKTHWTGGRIPGPVSDFVIRVHTVPPFDEPTVCERVELAEDDAGKNVAFRCSGGAEWIVVRLRGQDRHIRECDPPVGTATKPSFEALAKVVDIAPQLLDCASTPAAGSFSSRSAEIVRSVREEGGAAAATDLVVNAAARATAFDISGHDAWTTMLETLDDADRRSVLAKVCEGLRHVETPQPAYLQALRWCSLDDVKALGTSRSRASRGSSTIPRCASTISSCRGSRRSRAERSRRRPPRSRVRRATSSAPTMPASSSPSSRARSSPARR